MHSGFIRRTLSYKSQPGRCYFFVSFFFANVTMYLQLGPWRMTVDLRFWHLGLSLAAGEDVVTESTFGATTQGGSTGYQNWDGTFIVSLVIFSSRFLVLSTTACLDLFG